MQKIRVIYYACCLMLVIFVLSLPIWLTPDSVSFRNFETVNIPQLLGLLLLVALFQERTLEVFITTLREPYAVKLDHDIQKYEKDVSDVKKRVKDECQDDPAMNEAVRILENAEQERMKYKSTTQRIALLAGLALGLLISAVGVRTLQTFADPIASQGLSRVQAVVFRIVDVLLTGGLIAGGSEGIHKIANIYNAFTEKAANKGKGEKQEQLAGSMSASEVKQ